MIMRFSEMLRENHNTVHGKMQGEKEASYAKNKK
jgi:hypothetical protein